MRHVSFRIFFSLLLALTFTACDNGDSDGDGNGNGNGGGTIGDGDVTVTGGASDSFSGSAAFGVDEDDTNFGLAIFEGGFPTTGTPSGAFVAFGREGGRPAVGTYDLGPDDTATMFVGAYASDFGDFTGATFVSSESGTLTITASSSDRVAGSFSFSGQGISNGGPVGEITVEGTFDADFASNIPSTSFP